MYGKRGRGGGAERIETGTARIKRELERQGVAGKHLSVAQVLPV